MTSDVPDAIATAALIRSGAVSAREVTEAAIARIQKHNPSLNAVVATRFDEALAEVESLPDGPLTGVPMVVKDLGASVAGLPYTRGSRLWADNVAAADSELVARYKRAGLVVLGMSNSPEIGLSPSTEPVLHGPSRNPWKQTHSTGGSSGGTAAAVSAGLVPVGHASDGGGSIRIPGSACGLFGLKPSRGRVTPAPFATTLSTPLSISHALTRSVRDSALLLDLTADPLPGDALAAPRRPTTFTEQMQGDPGRLRIGLVTRRPDGGVTDEVCAEAARAAARLVEQLGHEVVEVELDHDHAALMNAFATMMGANLVSAVDERLAELGRDLREDDLEPFSVVLLEHYRSLTGLDVMRALRGLQETGWQVGRNFDDVDLLLSPTLALPVPELGTLDTTNPERMYVVASDYSAYTSMFNATGMPAMSIPFGQDPDGLPLGVQLVGDLGQEGLLLSLAARIEEAAPWHLLAPDYR